MSKYSIVSFQEQHNKIVQAQLRQAYIYMNYVRPYQT